MRIALSIRQPWAWLIVNGHKDVENRDWPTSYLGPVLIHASKTRDLEGYGKALQICELLSITLPPLDDLPKGGVVGEATLHDCVTESDSPWFVGKFGFLVREARPLPFVPFRGRLNFFNVDPAVLK